MKKAANSSELNDNELSRFNELSFIKKLLLHDYSGSKGVRMLAIIVDNFKETKVFKKSIMTRLWEVTVM